MILFILIVFAFATVRTIVPLGKQENWTFANVVFAAIHIVAYYYLCDMCLFIKPIF